MEPLTPGPPTHGHAESDFLSVTDRKKAEFNWPPERGATKISAKMEAILNFAPAGIYWTKRGVTFRYTVHKDGPGYHSKFSFIIRRKRIAQALREVSSGRYIVNNDAANWVWDGDSDIGDTQYPTNMKPNRAFSIDCPDHRIEEYVQITRSADFWETAHWHNGTEGEDGWSKITSDTNAKWYMNQTSVLPNGTKGGTNTHGPGPATAAAVFNTQPVANAGPNQAVAKGAAVTLTGAASP